MNYPSMDEDTFRQLRVMNQSRLTRWHGDAIPWLGVDWSNAMNGEAGEAANIVKKIRRIETGTGSQDGISLEELIAKLSLEIADTVIYADLLAAYYGLSLRAAVIHKFNLVSLQRGFPERIT